MNDYNVVNAIIEDVSITKAEYGVLTMRIGLDYGGSHQAFGGIALHLNKDNKHYNIRGVAGHFIWRVLEIADVDEVSELKGKCIRVEQNHCGIRSIGHILKDDWFCPEEDFKDI